MASRRSKEEEVEPSGKLSFKSCNSKLSIEIRGSNNSRLHVAPTGSQLRRGNEPTRSKLLDRDDDDEDEPSKLCVVLGDTVEGEIDYSIYVLDVKSVVSADTIIKPMPTPVLQLPCGQYPIIAGFGMVGSKLYMLGGCYDDISAVVNTNKMFIFDLHDTDIKPR